MHNSILQLFAITSKEQSNVYVAINEQQEYCCNCLKLLWNQGFSEKVDHCTQQDIDIKIMRVKVQVIHSRTINDVENKK
jgi:hypothetical protein